MVYELQVCPLKGNLTVQKIEVESEFADVIKVYRTGNVVSVNIDGVIISPSRVIFVTGLPPTLVTTWFQDLSGNNYHLYPNGSMSCQSELGTYVNLNTVYLAK